MKQPDDVKKLTWCMSELLGSPGGPGIERACLLWMLLIDGDLAILGLPGPCPPPPPAPDTVKAIAKFEWETALGIKIKQMAYND